MANLQIIFLIPSKTHERFFLFTYFIIRNNDKRKFHAIFTRKEGTKENDKHLIEKEEKNESEDIKKTTLQAITA